MIRRDRRGRLKIYLGYAAGVGKTYQMLSEGRRLMAEGVDVAAGIVETHGRLETAQLVEGLELLPRQKVEYHGVTLEEMDLDGVLARNPQVALVDELAHTNVPGSRNEKRYQDVQEILAAGINVIATLNVQHLESLYDLVERATGVKVRERLPDSVLADADQIVNVDVSPEDLQKRLSAGKIYPRERITTALNNFFQSIHLEQLRELTLRELASQLDSRRRETAEDKSRINTDQVMVCLDARGPENAALLRYGSRMAGRLNRNWYAVYVQTLAEDPVRIDATRQRHLSDTLTLANQLGATVFTFKGEDVADTFLRFAKEYRIGHVLIGKPLPQSWWRRVFGKPDVIEQLLRRGEDFNLIAINTRTGASQSGEEPPQPVLSPMGKTAIGGELCKWVEPATIRIWRDPVSKEQAMRDLVQALGRRHPDLNVETALAKLAEREDQGSTFLNEGVALPHARLEGLSAPLVALGLCHGGILDAHTQAPVEVVFVFLTPAGANKAQLQLLALAARFMQDRELRKRLDRVRESEEAFEVLKSWDAG